MYASRERQDKRRLAEQLKLYVCMQRRHTVHEHRAAVGTAPIRTETTNAAALRVPSSVCLSIEFLRRSGRRAEPLAAHSATPYAVW